jgi:hypothetical protein
MMSRTVAIFTVVFRLPGICGSVRSDTGFISSVQQPDELGNGFDTTYPEEEVVWKGAGPMPADESGAEGIRMSNLMPWEREAFSTVEALVEAAAYASADVLSEIEAEVINSDKSDGFSKPMAKLGKSDQPDGVPKPMGWRRSTAAMENDKPDESSRNVPMSSANVSTWCIALSGNGRRWASTLGFMSEALQLFIDEIGYDRSINLRCAVGAQSGAAAIILFQRLLANKNLGIPDNGLATPEQARAVARALSVLAQISELNELEIRMIDKYIMETSQMQTWRKEAWPKNKAPSEVKGAMMQYIRAIVLAEHMKPELADLKVADFITDHSDRGGFSMEELRSTAESVGLRVITDLPMLSPSKQRVYDETSLESLAAKASVGLQAQLEAIMSDVSSGVSKVAEDFLSGISITNVSLIQRNGINTLARAGDIFKESPLDKLLKESPMDGFISVTFVHAKNNTLADIKGASYAGLRVLAMMSRSTAEAVMASPSYKAQLACCRHPDRPENQCSVHGCNNADRYIIGVVDHMRPMLTLSLMEPGNNRPHAATLSQLGVTAVFDPEYGFSDAEDMVLEATSDLFNPIKLVLGGLVDRGQSVKLQEFYTEGRQLQNVGFALFGIDGESKEARNLVKNVLDGGSGFRNAVKRRLAGRGMAGNNWKHFMDWAQPRPTSTLFDGNVYLDCRQFRKQLTPWQLRVKGVIAARISSTSLRSLVLTPSGASSEGSLLEMSFTAHGAGAFAPTLPSHRMEQSRSTSPRFQSDLGTRDVDATVPAGSVAANARAEPPTSDSGDQGHKASLVASVWSALADC